MNNSATNRLLAALVFISILTAAVLLFFTYIENSHKDKTASNIAKEPETMERAEKKAARSEYFFRLMRDPATNNPDVMYVFTLKGAGDNSNEGVSFFRIDISDPQNPVAEDRSENLPDFRVDGEGMGFVDPQGGYNMVVDVKPDDEDFVFLGGRNLYRSSDGFESTPSEGYDGEDQLQKNEYWIGGFAHDNSFNHYPNQHPDQHILFFPEPEERPSRMWAGHDGGVSFSNDISLPFSPSIPSVDWEDRSSGYITSQFYTVAIPNNEDDPRFLGGTQDNGTPYFTFENGSASSSVDVSSGDGSFVFWGDEYVFVSYQRGVVTRIKIDSDGNLSSPNEKPDTEWTHVYPSSASDQLFIHPYVIDPNDETTMYYPSGSTIWRNTKIDEIPNHNTGGTNVGWEELREVNTGSHTISALNVSTEPNDILYFGGYHSDRQPTVKKIVGAKTATGGATDISLPDNSNLEGAYIKDIAINPTDADEVIVVLSNYNIQGLYHTIDGGENWTPIEGNLTGTEQNPGPSLRSAEMIPAESGTLYILGTSTGIYSTQMLDGENTAWGKEAESLIGNVVIGDLATRTSDGDIAAGSHGRGMFHGDFQGNTNAPYITADPKEGSAEDIVTIEANDFEFSSNADENNVTFGEARARVINAATKEIKVEVPRGSLNRNAEKNSVILSVETDNNSLSTTFNILPPDKFSVKQNYPNPFNSATAIPFDVPDDARVTLSIYDINGKKVLQPIFEKRYNAGSYIEKVNISEFASGVFFYRLYFEALSREENAMESKQMTFIK